MNGDDFVLAADGWVHVTPCGKFPHAGAGVVQVIDRAACDAMEADFNARKADTNFPGVLVDFDPSPWTLANRARRPGGLPNWSRATRGSGRVYVGRTRVLRPCKAVASAS